MPARNDGCPRCLKRDNEPKTWDESTGKATYRCKCGHAWSTWWEHDGSTVEPAKFGDLVNDFLGPDSAAALSTREETR